MIDLNKLAEEIHAAAVEKGFWDVEEAEEKHLAKMISELGEVVQADRAGVMYEVERDGAKPEGVVAELADFVMMALDWYVHSGNIDEAVSVLNRMGATRPARLECRRVKSDLPYMVMILANDILSVRFGNHTNLCRAVFSAAIMAKSFGYDLWEIIRAKMEYNKSRPALHGRLY